MSIFICSGNPKYHLCLVSAEHFSKIRHALLTKMAVFDISGQHLVNRFIIFCNLFPISVNVCQHAVLRTYLPTIRYCVRTAASQSGGTL